MIAAIGVSACAVMQDFALCWRGGFSAFNFTSTREIRQAVKT